MKIPVGAGSTYNRPEDRSVEERDQALGHLVGKVTEQDDALKALRGQIEASLSRAEDRGRVSDEMRV